MTTLEEELGVRPKPLSFTADAIRKMQEMAYTRYLGQEPHGGSKTAAPYSLDAPSKVYERVALWIAQKYPLDSTAKMIS